METDLTPFSPARLRACAALFSLVLATPWSLAQAPTTAPKLSPTVKIGVIGPFTGPSADFGIPMLNGIKLAADEINASGGVPGPAA